MRGLLAAQASLDAAVAKLAAERDKVKITIPDGSLFEDMWWEFTGKGYAKRILTCIQGS